MIDIETLGPAPDGCIVSIGVVHFRLNPRGGNTSFNPFV